MTVLRPLRPRRVVPRGIPWLLALGVGVALAVRLTHWGLADRVWEDALITLAHVRNAVEGIGLTHHAGEGLVHGFTSALSVLVPLPAELLAPGSGLTAMRVVSLLATCVALAAGYAISRLLGTDRWGMGFVLAYLALDQLQIFFGMSGMETQIATALLLAAVWAVLEGRVAPAGLLAGLGILARPDFAIWALIVLVWAAGRERMALARAGALMATVVVPWIAFTTAVYGSPMPQTIVAKNLIYSTIPETASLVDWGAWLLDRGGSGLLAVIAGFTPFYEDGVTLAAPAPAGVLVAAGIGFAALTGVGAWATRRIPGTWTVRAYIGAFALYWVLLLPLGYFMWYQPPFLALCAILAGAGITAMRRRYAVIGAALAVGLGLAFSMHLPWSVPLDRTTQMQIEDGVRQAAGEFLSTAVSPGEAVTAEAAGYLGWYGRVELWDYPGLTSSHGLAATRSLPRSQRRLSEVIAVLRPEWLVLRPHELEDLARVHPRVAACYATARTFGEVQPPVVSHGGLVRWNQDHALIVLARIEPCDG